MLKKYLFPILVVSMIISCAPKNVQQLSWQKTESFSATLPKNYDDKAKIAYELTNDKAFLYIKLQINEEVMQRQVMLSGLQLWFDTTQKYNDNISLFYPLKEEFGARPKERPSQDVEGPNKDMRDKYLTAQNRFQSQSLKGIPNGFNSINETEISLKLSFNEYGSMVYNAKIPLTSLYVQNLNNSDIFTLHIKVPAMAMPSNQGGAAQGGPPAGGGGKGGQGGPPNGGGGGGQGPGGQGGQSADGAPSANSNQSSMATDKDVKIKFSLNTDM